MRDYDIIHRVKNGETITSISELYKVPTSLIIKDNMLGDEIYEGQRLLISPIKGIIYTVKPTDTLQVIADKFGIEKQLILQDNNIEAVYPFMNIVIKKPTII